MSARHRASAPHATARLCARILAAPRCHCRTVLPHRLYIPAKTGTAMRRLCRPAVAGRPRSPRASCWATAPHLSTTGTRANGTAHPDPTAPSLQSSLGTQSGLKKANDGFSSHVSRPRVPRTHGAAACTGVASGHLNYRVPCTSSPGTRFCRRAALCGGDVQHTRNKPQVQNSWSPDVPVPGLTAAGAGCSQAGGAAAHSPSRTLPGCRTKHLSYFHFPSGRWQERAQEALGS